MGFEYFLPDFNTYDITSCFEGDKMDHRLIRIGWVKNMDVKGGIKIIRDQIRTQASIGAKVSLIRIQNIEVGSVTISLKITYAYRLVFLIP